MNLYGIILVLPALDNVWAFATVALVACACARLHR
jgi:hypothetical protein